MDLRVGPDDEEDDVDLDEGRSVGREWSITINMLSSLPDDHDCPSDGLVLWLDSDEPWAPEGEKRREEDRGKGWEEGSEGRREWERKEWGRKKGSE